MLFSPPLTRRGAGATGGAVWCEEELADGQEGVALVNSDDADHRANARSRNSSRSCPQNSSSL